MLFLYSRFIVNSLSLSFSPQLMRGAEIPEIAFQVICCSHLNANYTWISQKCTISHLHFNVEIYFISISIKAMPSMFLWCIHCVCPLVRPILSVWDKQSQGYRYASKTNEHIHEWKGHPSSSGVIHNLITCRPPSAPPIRAPSWLKQQLRANSCVRLGREEVAWILTGLPTERSQGYWIE